MSWDIGAEAAAARKRLGARLKKYREELAGRSVDEVAKDIGVGRQYVYQMEKGKANFAIDKYIRALRACGVSFEEFLEAMQSSDIPAEHRPFYDMLAVILKSGKKELIDGIRVNLEAISEKVQRLQKIEKDDKPPPRKQRHA